MSSPPDPPPANPEISGSFARRTTILSCTVACALGFAALAGWAFDVRVLRGATPTWLGMAPAAALALLCLGIALLCAMPPAGSATRRVAAVAGAIVAGVLSASALVASWLRLPPTRVDLLLFAERVQRAGEAMPAGRMGPTTAEGILFLAVAVFALAVNESRATARGDLPRRWVGRFRWLDQVITAAAALAAGEGLVAGVVHLYAGQSMFRMYALNPMAFNTAIAITVLGVGVLMARPGVGLAAIVTGNDAGAVMARQLAPVAVLVPIVIGSLHIAADQTGILSPTAASTMQVLAEMLIVLAVVVRTARQLRVLDLDRNAERRRLAIILDRLPVGVIVADAEGAVVHQNPASRELFGSSIATVRGLDPAPVGGAVHADGAPYRALEYPITRALLGRSPVVRETLKYERPDGSRITLSVSATPVLDETGALTYVVASIEDVSDREDARAAAVEANAAKGQFLANMSHELRTPLNAIAGHVQLIELGIHGPLTDAQRDALARVQKAQTHLLALITNVLSFARLEAGRVEFTSRPVRVREVVQEVVRLMEPQAAAGGLTLCCSMGDANAEEAEVAVADRDKVVQALLNLVGNAIKFTPSVQPSGAPGAITITIDAPPDGASVAIAVTDTGIGVPADRLTAIFDPFVQARSDLTREHGGAGLGLAISRELARAMNGDLRVTSTVGEGSTFTLVLPRERHLVGAVA